MSATVIRCPSDADWARCYYLATATAGRATERVPDEAWRRSMLRAGHSPIRTLCWTIELSVPYWVSVHLVRHKMGVEHFVRSQRNDRQSDYDRNKAPQDAPVTHVMDANAAALMQMAHMRLCGKAARETREAMRDVCRAVVEVSPEMAEVLVPKCRAHGGCDEMRPCMDFDAMGWLP